MSYEGEPNEKPQIYGDPYESNHPGDPRISDDDPEATEDYDDNCMRQGYSNNSDCPNCGGELFISDDNYFLCEICGWHGYYYGD